MLDFHFQYYTDISALIPADTYTNPISAHMADDTHVHDFFRSVER